MKQTKKQKFKPYLVPYPSQREKPIIPNRCCNYCSHLLKAYNEDYISCFCEIPNNDEALHYDETCHYFEALVNQLLITITAQDLDLLRQIKETFVVIEEKGLSITIGAHQVIMTSTSYEIYTNSQLLLRISCERIDKIEVR